MVSTEPPAKASTAEAAPTVEAARATDATRVATADLRAERRARLPSPWTPDEPLSGDALSGDDDAADRNDSGASEETRTRLAARVLRATAELCGAPLSVSIAALVYLVVFYERPEHSHAADSPRDVVPACLLLASKIEEKPTRVSDVVNAMQRVLCPLRRDPPLFSGARAARVERETPTASTRPETTAVYAARARAETPAGPTDGGAPSASTAAEAPGERDARDGGRDDVTNASLGDGAARAPGTTTDVYPPAMEKARYMRETIAALRKKHPHHGPKSLYASAEAMWKTAPANPESDAARAEREGKKNQPAKAAEPRTSLETDARAATTKDGRSGVTKTRVTIAAGSAKGTSGAYARDEDDPNFRLSRPVIGDAYYETKARVLRAEQLVLRAVDGEVNVPRVANALLNVAHSLRAPKAVAKLALVALVDALFETTSDTKLARGLFFGAEAAPSMGARAPLALAGDAAAAAVRVAARLCGYALERDATALGVGARWTRARDEPDERKSVAGTSEEPFPPAEETKRRKRSDDARFSRLDTRREDGDGDARLALPDPWWVEMEFDPASVERIERDMLRVLVRGAEASRTFEY